MSRIGKTPIKLPKEVKISISSSNVSVEGPKGKLSLNIPRGIKIEQKDDNLLVTRLNDSKQDKSNHGTIRARLFSNIEGVTKGHKKNLEIQGIGFRALLDGKKIVFNLGFSHPVNYQIPENIKITVPTQTSISVEGCDSMLVGHTAAKIRDLKPVEPYKGKGIRYVGEVVRRKQGKTVTK